MHPEQSKPVERPREVLQRMQRNQVLGEKMDPGMLLSDIGLLDQLGATNLPGLKKEILEPFGQVPLVESAVVDGFKEAGSTGDQAGLAKYIRLAELMGIFLPLLAADTATEAGGESGGATQKEIQLPPTTATEPEKPPEQPGIQVYNKPWQEVFGGAPPPWSGLSGHVYQPYEHHELVVKVFDKEPQNFQRELHAFEKLKGTKHAVQLLGRGSPDPKEQYLSPNQYLVKEYIAGDNMYANTFCSPLPIKTGESHPADYEKQRKVGTWLVSSMEALAEAHTKGVLIGDFKFADFPWDPVAQKTVLIDFANAYDTNPQSNFYTRDRIPFNDINELLKVFWSMTPPGKNLGFGYNSLGIIPWPTGVSPQSLVEKAKAYGSTSTFLKIAEMMSDNMSFEPGRTHIAQEYVQALKDYFAEVGIDISQSPTADRTISADQPTAEQAVVEKVDDITKQFGIPPEDIWTIYGMRQQEQEG